ncbi:hypothetical protein GmHk_06G015114 [Glycine max]|nr:hypothetical protein GmHk_06G015114 [Glycine max]
MYIVLNKSKCNSLTTDLINSHPLSTLGSEKPNFSSIATALGLNRSTFYFWALLFWSSPTK